MDNLLNLDQKKAVEHEEGPLLILAGAGSGKTRVLVSRAAWLINKRGINPSKIALLTFTNKAASEMKERVEKVVGSKVDLGFSGTFHTFCSRLLREYGAAIGINRNFVIYDSDDSQTVMKEVLKELEIDPKQNKPGMFLAIIGKMKNDLISLEHAEENAKDYFYRQVAKIWRTYQKKLRMSNAVDFDDLLVLAVRLLEIPSVKEEINSKIDWILVDEYQDTNKAQFELTKHLAGKNRNITAVGDAAQAIYSFRGADYRNLTLLEEAYPDLKTIGLPTNYRSTQYILDSAYSVVSKNTKHPSLKLSATRELGDKPEIYTADDERDEAKFVVERARKASTKEDQVAILYRTNAQSRAFEDELLRRDIPYKLIGGLRFYNRAEVKDLIAYLRLVFNPDEGVSQTRVEKLGKRKYKIFESWLTNQDKSEVTNRDPGELLEEIINVTNYLEKFDERDENDAVRIENINELLAVASEYSNLVLFLESAALSEAEVKQHKSKANIVLMTIHAAKGLEFDSVFVTGLEEGLFPHSRSIFEGGKEEIEEERRLMYVAMTRAKEHLTLSWAKTRLSFGGRHVSIPSRFLSEIPEDLLRKAESRDLRFDNKKPNSLDEFGEKKRIIVQDWEIEEASRGDFADIDSW